MRKDNKNNQPIEALEQEVREKVAKETQNKTLRNIFIFVAILFVALIGAFVYSSQQETIDYRGVEFKLVNEIAPYKTTILVEKVNTITGAFSRVPYSYYLRTDPRELDAIPFDGSVELKQTLVVNTSNDFNCDGNGILGMTNLARLYATIGAEVVKNETIGCSQNGTYMFLHLEEGEKTAIERIGESCYRMTIRECEVLEATERFMLETFVEVNSRLEARDLI